MAKQLEGQMMKILQQNSKVDGNLIECDLVFVQMPPLISDAFCMRGSTHLHRLFINFIANKFVFQIFFLSLPPCSCSQILYSIIQYKINTSECTFLMHFADHLNFTLVVPISHNIPIVTYPIGNVLIIRNVLWIINANG